MPTLPTLTAKILATLADSLEFEDGEMDGLVTALVAIVNEQTAPLTERIAELEADSAPADLNPYIESPSVLPAYIKEHYGVPAGTYARKVQRNAGAQPILVPEDHEGAVCIPDEEGVSRYWIGTTSRPHVRPHSITCPDGTTKTVPACFSKPLNTTIRVFYMPPNFIEFRPSL